MKKRMHKLVPYLVGSCLLTMVACGSDDDDNGSGVTPTPPEEQQETVGNYRATITPIPLNTTVAGNPTGALDIVIEGDEVTATMNMQGVPSNIVHAQHITVGSSCPTATNDVNNDSYVDVLEGAPNYGLILIPLDGDLEDQDDGQSGFPVANAAGTYNWTKTASLSRMIADLQDADIDLEDGLTKLNGSELNLDGKVVIVHGVLESSNLPDSVATIDDYKSHESLPIACGIIQRVEEETTTGTTGETTTGGTGQSTTDGASTEGTSTTGA